MRQVTQREVLEAAVRAQAAERLPWERAEHCVFESALRERLAQVGITPDADLAVALMATAMLLAEASPEWGGDYRDALADVAQAGLALLPE